MSSLVTDSVPAEPLDGSQLLSDISQFIAHYLQCSPEQRTVLAFWVLHTYCFSVAEVTPYLSIQSGQKQSGKTLCLQLLSLLVGNPSLTCTLNASGLMHRMRLNPPSAILLDECQATVGTRSRPKAPVLCALLATSYYACHGRLEFKQDNQAFCPKAFAGRGPLPEELGELALPIILQPIRERNGLRKFKAQFASEEAGPIRKRLADWASQHLPALANLPRYADEDFPASLPHLSLPRQDMIEPLLQLARKIGGEWPERLRQSLIALFAEEAAFHLQASLDILNALYGCFCHYGFPERIATGTLLEWLQTQPQRPWDADGSITAQMLARLLAAVDIRPRLQRIGKGNPARGYMFEDFRPAWKRHFNYQFLPAEVMHPKSGIANPRPRPEPGLFAAESNKDKACNGLVQDAQVSIPAPPNTVCALPLSEFIPMVAEVQLGNMTGELANCHG
jgi:hypothetical protein